MGAEPSHARVVRVPAYDPHIARLAGYGAWLPAPDEGCARQPAVYGRFVLLEGRQDHKENRGWCYGASFIRTGPESLHGSDIGLFVARPWLSGVHGQGVFLQ